MEERCSDLEEPLLTAAQEGEPQEQALVLEAARSDDDDDEEAPNNDEAAAPSSSGGRESDFSTTNEMWEMLALGLPLAVSFFCRMGMASTDSAFVGHLHSSDSSDGGGAALYLAAAVLSDMVLNVCITPPLAFNQVLNALVGQAMGSNNPKMAGIWLQQSCFFLFVTMLPCLVGLFHVERILLWLDFDAMLARTAGTYAKYNVIWPIPNGLYQCMRFYFQAQGLPRPAMYNNLVFLFVNAALNWFFVFGCGPLLSWPGLGFIGAAISLSISRTLQSLSYFVYMFVYKHHHVATWPGLSWKFHTRQRTTEFLKQSLPNIGTLLFQTCASQATTVLVGRLGQDAIAASSALSTVSIPWSGTLSATATTISSVRVGYHLGRGSGKAAQRSAWLVGHFLTVVVVVVAVVFIPLKRFILQFATDDEDIVDLSATLVLPMLLGTYLNILVGNITSGVFSGMGRPLIATILSFGFELPMSIGGVALYIIYFHGNLLGVYWWTAISGAIEVLVVLAILIPSDWDHWADQAMQRQEASSATQQSPTTTTTTTSTEDSMSVSLLANEDTGLEGDDGNSDSPDAGNNNEKLDNGEAAAVSTSV